MKTFTNDDFLRLIDDLDDQYGDDADDPENDFVWVPADPLYKKKIKSPGPDGVIDLSTIKKENIKDKLFNHTMFKVGIYTIRITRYSSDPNDSKNKDLSLDLSFLYDETKTPSGIPCEMQYKFEPSKDNRFNQCSWLKYLTNSSTMKNVPIDEVVEIIRWFQGVHRMTAFF
jgi:hypothetical protein